MVYKELVLLNTDVALLIIPGLLFKLKQPADDTQEKKPPLYPLSTQRQKRPEAHCDLAASAGVGAATKKIPSMTAALAASVNSRRFKIPPDYTNEENAESTPFGSLTPSRIRCSDPASAGSTTSIKSEIGRSLTSISPSGLSVSMPRIVPFNA